MSKRKRVDRRARARLEQKEFRDFRRSLDADLTARIAKVRAAVAPEAPVFWHVFKRRIAARETFRPLDSIETVRDVAMAVLREDGHDLTGIILKVFWEPPVLLFDPAPSAENAVAVVDQVRATDRGQARLRQIRALGG